MPLSKRFWLAGFAALGMGVFGLSVSANAAVITTGTAFTVADSGVAPGVSTDYTFFGANAATRPGSQPTNLTHFTETSLPPNEFGAVDYPGHSYSTYSNIKAPGSGTVFRTGIGYGTTAAGAQNLTTFKLDAGSGTNRSFSVYVLYGNTNGISVVDSKIGLSANGGTPITAFVTDTTSTNQFLEFKVTGANPGDTFTVSATRNSTATNMPYIGGVTFSAIPEPTSLALLSLTGLGLLKRRRRVG